MKPIVVAVHGSPTSAAALRWAADQAAVDGRPLRVVTAYLEPFFPSEITGGMVEHLTAAEADARRAARSVIDEVLGDGGCDWEHVVALSTVDDLLRRHAADAHLLVVGARASSWRARRRSVVARLTGRVTCPVVAIPTSPAPLAA
jgi:nucleotide-binding universal stress UspA family protein